MVYLFAQNMSLPGEIFMSLYRSCCYFAASKKCCFGRFRDMKINGIRSQDSVFESFLINNVTWNIVASFLWVLKWISSPRILNKFNLDFIITFYIQCRPILNEKGDRITFTAAKF